MFPSLTVTGQSISEIIQGWFHDDRCTAFVVLREQEPVGFAVVQRTPRHARGQPKRHYRLSEFFIRRPFRRKGVGRGAAMLIFARYAGEWTIAEQSRNAARDPLLAPRRLRVHQRQVPREARAGRGRALFTSAGPVGVDGALNASALADCRP